MWLWSFCSIWLGTGTGTGTGTELDGKSMFFEMCGAVRRGFLGQKGLRDRIRTGSVLKRT
jgi:hypothetical protein